MEEFAKEENNGDVVIIHMNIKSALEIDGVEGTLHPNSIADSC